MSAEASPTSFEEWLLQKLSVLGIDQEVFGNYITGILTGEESESEKRDALEDVLSGVTESDIPDLCCEIMKEWAKAQSVSNGIKDKIVNDGENDVGAKLAVIMEKQAQSVVRESMHTAEEKMMREAILAQYSHVSDEEDDYYSDTEDRGNNTNSAPSSILPRNENVHSVVQAEKEKREKAKAESEKKKAQDKLNREKQKQQQQERKDREKKRTQKGERKR